MQVVIPPKMKEEYVPTEAVNNVALHPFNMRSRGNIRARGNSISSSDSNEERYMGV